VDAILPETPAFSAGFHKTVLPLKTYAATGFALVWLLVLALAGLLRFHDLGVRPVHADEATGARLVARTLDGSYRFDPTHYHGPVLHRLGQLAAGATGSHHWADLDILPLRAITALAGLLIVALPLLGIRRFGHGPMLLAAALLATSPLLVYYSRTFIHETLLALFGGLVLVQLSLRKHLWLTGLWLGLMAATKETSAISVVAWTLSGAACWLLPGKHRPSPAALLRTHRHDLIPGLALFLLTTLLFYTDGFRHWHGAIDAVRTFFVYETVSGHGKPPTYYLQLLGFPEKHGAHWWWTGAPLLLALVGALASVRPTAPASTSLASASPALPLITDHSAPGTPAQRAFLPLSALLHLLIYSLIPYKTPWLMAFPLAQLLVLAGFSIQAPKSRTSKAIFTTALALILSWQLVQTCRANFTSTTRHPHAYVPTSPDLATLPAWLDQLDAAQPPLVPIAVVGGNHWPLPWYLRQRQQVSYWPDPPDQPDQLPLVFTTTDLTETLAPTHIPVPRGLRDGDPMTAWVRHDLWNASTGN
jgi:uncharacterized protein (TIGR03663 family)